MVVRVCLRRVVFFSLLSLPRTALFYIRCGNLDLLLQEMLKEKGVAPFSKWEKELPKIIFDLRFKVCSLSSGDASCSKIVYGIVLFACSKVSSFTQLMLIVSSISDS